MKKLAVLASLALLFFIPLFVYADYATDYQNYINQMGNYQTSYNSYLTARANYLASGSLDSQDKAQIATAQMLKDRDLVVVDYLTAMSTKIKESQGISPADKITYQNLLTTEINWYNAHAAKISSAGSLSDLVNDSDEAKQEFSGLTTYAVYVSLINLGAGLNNYIRGEINGEITSLNAKIAEIKANQDKDVSSIERLMIDIQNKVSRSQDKDNAAKDLINSIKPTDTRFGSTFDDAQMDLTDSNSYLKEANQGLLQIITQIKTN